jgi:3-methylfumaryl-CoA hydratase
VSTDWDEWIGRQRRSEATLDPWPAAALEQVLDLRMSPADNTLPPLWHWLYFLDTAPQHKIGPDGHPLKGDFLPPVPNPRRMFAGARTRFLAPLRLGCETELLETVSSVEEKSGGQGTLYLVTVSYDYSQADQLCVSEQRDFIYLPAVPSGRMTGEVDLNMTAVPDAPWSMDVSIDATRLMRFSALTFNSHRIHYDLDYARSQEAYPGLVVHGPLTAILLSELCRMNDSRVLTNFSFRAQAPLFCDQLIRLRGEPADNGAGIKAMRPDGKVAIAADASFG